ncbi:lysozyme C, spleen isozyme [Cheilinus undulatus]|uniref:lysozyme C, spleen isozyme n=1 Tax=Cheilinus undulatus TaxID=241271 RepID=UPI001BD3C418|nr:lysozyme C, spleen isozyme [Cheilinus undulatus]
MRVLLVFLLGLSLAGGELVDKCDLRNRLMTALSSITDGTEPGRLGVENIVAKIVCHVSQTSHYDTSVVNSPPSSSHLKEKFYGLFQLTGEVVCSEGDKDPSHTLCEMNCSGLCDRDITDDIDCILKILKKMIKDGYKSDPKFLKMIQSILGDCRDGQVSNYFSDCP